MHLAPKPTRYQGYHFRSRLEARWAVFFDHLGLRWEYEPEGFDLPSGRSYLPDFLVKTCGGEWWVEVKPEACCHSPLAELVVASGEEADLQGVVLGQPCSEDKVWIIHAAAPEEAGFHALGHWADFMAFHQVWKRMRMFNPAMETIDLVDLIHDRHLVAKELDSVCDAALSARFEWGESGAT